jgi:hypothetical protein
MAEDMEGTAKGLGMMRGTEGAATSGTGETVGVEAIVGAGAGVVGGVTMMSGALIRKPTIHHSQEAQVATSLGQRKRRSKHR